MLTPQCVTVDAQDNIYVTDSQSGKVFVFDPSGKFRRTIGSLKGGEGYFKRPTGIAVDSAAQRIYVTDTLRNKIYMMDMQGSVLQVIGKPGTGDGEFNFPTELRLNGTDLVVVDAMNFRVQVLDRSGTFRYAIGKVGDGAGWMFRPKGIGFDSEGHLYVVDAQWGMVQVFDEQGRLLYYFGQRGTGAGPVPVAGRARRSTTKIAFTWSTRLTGEFRYSITTVWRKRRMGGNREGAPFARLRTGLCGSPVAECGKRPGQSSQWRRARHAQSHGGEWSVSNDVGRSGLHLLPRSAQWIGRRHSIVESETFTEHLHSLQQHDVSRARATRSRRWGLPVACA